MPTELPLHLRNPCDLADDMRKRYESCEPSAYYLALIQELARIHCDEYESIFNESFSRNALSTAITHRNRER